MRRHRGKQGQENAFKGPLRDLDLHHPPCRGYRANQAFYALGWIAQALLRAVQFTALPKRTRKHGLRPVIRHVMRTAAYMVRTARRLFVRFAKTNFHLDWLYEAMAHPGGPRPAACVGGLTGPVRFDAALRRRRTRPAAGGRKPLRTRPGRSRATTASAPAPEPLSSAGSDRSTRQSATVAPSTGDRGKRCTGA